MQRLNTAGRVTLLVLFYAATVILQLFRDAPAAGRLLCGQRLHSGRALFLHVAKKNRPTFAADERQGRVKLGKATRPGAAIG